MEERKICEIWEQPVPNEGAEDIAYWCIEWDAVTRWLLEYGGRGSQ